MLSRPKGLFFNIRAGTFSFKFREIASAGLTSASDWNSHVRFRLNEVSFVERCTLEVFAYVNG